jgi:hypothetical protein
MKNTSSALDIQPDNAPTASTRPRPRPTSIMAKVELRQQLYQEANNLLSDLLYNYVR